MSPREWLRALVCLLAAALPALPAGELREPRNGVTTGQRFERVFPDGARLLLEPGPGTRAVFAQGEAGRPEIRCDLSGNIHGAVRIEDGDLLIRIGSSGRLSIRARSTHGSVPAMVLVRGRAGSPPGAGGGTHVITVLPGNEVSDLRSGYFLAPGGDPGGRIQFSRSEYAAGGCDLPRLLRDRLQAAGTSSDGKDVLLIPEAAEAYRKLSAAYQRRRGHPLRFSGTRSGYRSFEDQERSWRSNIPEAYEEYFRRTGRIVHERKVAVPGYSQHGTGGAMDFLLADALDPVLRELAPRFGFLRSETATRYRKGRFRFEWEDRPHFLYVGTGGAEVTYFPGPGTAGRSEKED